jgi:hypothetical protein
MILCTLMLYDKYANILLPVKSCSEREYEVEMRSEDQIYDDVCHVRRSVNNCRSRNKKIRVPGYCMILYMMHDEEISRYHSTCTKYGYCMIVSQQSAVSQKRMNTKTLRVECSRVSSSRISLLIYFNTRNAIFRTPLRLPVPPLQI